MALMEGLSPDLSYEEQVALNELHVLAASGPFEEPKPQELRWLDDIEQPSAEVVEVSFTTDQDGVYCLQEKMSDGTKVLHQIDADEVEAFANFLLEIKGIAKDQQLTGEVDISKAASSLFIKKESLRAFFKAQVDFNGRKALLVAATAATVGSGLALTPKSDNSRFQPRAQTSAVVGHTYIKLAPADHEEHGHVEMDEAPKITIPVKKPDHVATESSPLPNNEQPKKPAPPKPLGHVSPPQSPKPQTSGPPKRVLTDRVTKRGENLTKIARTTHETLEELLSDNPIYKAHPNLVKKGSVLHIRQAESLKKPEAASAFQHLTISKDWLKGRVVYTALKQDFGFNNKQVMNILTQSSIKNKHWKIGQELIIPQGYLMAQGVAVKGTTLEKLAHTFHTTPEAIASASGIKNINQLKLGQHLNIPTNTEGYANWRHFLITASHPKPAPHKIPKVATPHNFGAIIAPPATSEHGERLLNVPLTNAINKSLAEYHANPESNPVKLDEIIAVIKQTFIKGPSDGYYKLPVFKESGLPDIMAYEFSTGTFDTERYASAQTLATILMTSAEIGIQKQPGGQLEGFPNMLLQVGDLNSGVHKTHDDSRAVDLRTIADWHNRAMGIGDGPLFNKHSSNYSEIATTEMLTFQSKFMVEGHRAIRYVLFNGLSNENRMMLVHLIGGHTYVQLASADHEEHGHFEMDEAPLAIFKAPSKGTFQDGSEYDPNTTVTPPTAESQPNLPKLNEQQLAIIDSLKPEQAEFLKAYLPSLLQAYNENPNVSLVAWAAQTLLETGSCNDTLCKTANNLSGIKATEAWKAKGGKFVTVETTEFRNGVATRVMADFKKYDTVLDYARDYIGVITSKPFYQDAVANAKNPEMYLMGLIHELNPDGSVSRHQGEPGVQSYATSPTYVENVLNTAQTMKLQEIIDAGKVDNDPELQPGAEVPKPEAPVQQVAPPPVPVPAPVVPPPTTTVTPSEPTTPPTSDAPAPQQTPELAPNVPTPPPSQSTTPEVKPDAKQPVKDFAGLVGLLHARNAKG